MNYLTDKILRGTHRLYVNHYGSYLKPIDSIMDPEKASNIIYQQLKSDSPSMVARYGSTEILCVNNYLGIKKYKHNIIDYITDKIPQFWWNQIGIYNMQHLSGFFPLTELNLERFGELMIEDSKHVDILGSWRIEERRLIDINKVKTIQLLLLEPYHAKHPWSRVLKGKKVLVIHPFAETIQHQDKRDYDIALIGCGAYGFPLAAHVKRTGKKAVHLGGALQLLFGIKGKRWINPYYGKVFLPFLKENYYNNLMNEFWVYPSESERPSNAANVEGACYW